MTRRLGLEYQDILRNYNDTVSIISRYRGIRGQYSWDCNIFIEDNRSAYRNSFIRFTLKFPPEYPFKAPVIKIKTPIFHPYIHGASGDLCSHILPYFWRKKNGGTGTVKMIIKILATLFKDEGKSLKNIKSLCQDHSIAHTCDTEYCLFDKIIQKCLGHELDEDPDPNDPFFDHTSIKPWEDQVKDQRALNAIQSHLCAEMFAGRLPEIETITRRLLGLVEGSKSEEFQTIQTLPAVTTPKKECTLVSSDGTTITCPKWSTLELIYSLDAGENIPTILSTDMIQKVLALCHARGNVEIRKYNQMEWFFKLEIDLKYQIMTPEETWEVLNAANFLGGHEIVLGCCLRLCKYFVYSSRIQYTVDKLRKK